jgi:hypothetical protein
MRSYVVTGGGRCIGRALVERLTQEGHVVVLDLEADARDWTREHSRISAIAGDAGDEAVAARAADAAEEAGQLVGWVNNAAIFRDTALHDVPASEVLELIAGNLGLAVTGCATAIRSFLASGSPGAIVNVSSHQAQRPVPGALAYATVTPPAVAPTYHDAVLMPLERHRELAASAEAVPGAHGDPGGANTPRWARARCAPTAMSHQSAGLPMPDRAAALMMTSPSWSVMTPMPVR